MEKEDIIELVDAFNAKLEEYRKEIDDFKKDIYDNFITPAQKNYEEWDHSTRLEDFRSKYPELSDLSETVKTIENDPDFDVVDKVFDDYDSMEGDKPEEAAYVASVVASLTDQIEKLKSALNAEDVEVETKDDGNVEVKADGEPVAEAETTTIKEEEVVSDDDNDDDDSFEKEIEEGLKKANRFKL